VAPETKYAHGPSGAVAYQVFGEGPDLVFITQWGTNIDLFWDEPSAARYLDRLASFSRVILFDKRGTGISDPIPMHQPPTMAGWIEDVETVMAAAGSESATLIGDTEGGLLAIAAAAQRPDLVERLVLINSRARATRTDDYPQGMPDHLKVMTRLAFVDAYGSAPEVLNTTAPSAADDPRFKRWWLKFQRATMSPAMVAAGFDWMIDADVREEAAKVTAPTLVIHRKDAMYHRIDGGRWLADNIQGASMVELEGADTLPFHTGDFNEILDHVETFVTGDAKIQEDMRRLATVLFTDIVSSTERASQLGDEKWLDLLAEANLISETQVRRFGGTPIHTTGDGQLAIFDLPVQAIDAGRQILAEVASLGIEMRAGIHTGEITVTDDDVAGIGVHIASRILDHAPDGGIAVSSTVRDLTVGSRHTFTEVGSFTLKGVPGTWTLYQAS